MPETGTAVSGELLEFVSASTGFRPGMDDDFFALGLVDSLFALELVTFVERRYAFEVEVEDLDLDNFRTVSRLTGFVLAKTRTPR